MDNKKNGIPKLRFPGFTGAWEQRKLEEITSVITKGTTPLDKSGKGSINFVKVEDLSPDNSGINVHSMISKEEHEGRLKRSILKENDILFSIAGTLGRIGIVKSEILPANTNQALAIVRLKEGNLSYISTVLEGRTVREYIRQNPTVGAQPNLSLKQVSELRISFPTLQEQEQVGNFFNKLNSFIALHQRKLEHLQEQKKGLLQKMFPKNGENVPEVRFPGFTDAWEQRKLGEVVEMFNGDRGNNYPKDSELISEGIPFINTGDLKNGQIDLKNCKKISREKFNQLSGAKIRQGDILYCLRGTLGKNAIVKFNEGTVASSLVDIRPKTINGIYLFIILNSDIEYRQRILNDEGAAQPNLSVRNLAKFIIPVPKTKEQQKIGDFFNQIDTLITLHQRKLEHLELMKKGLLQQMFV